MSWGISPNATEKEKIFADFNDSLNGMNCADGLSYHHYSKIYDMGRELADKEYDQGRADQLKEDCEITINLKGGVLADHDNQIIENTFKVLNQALKDLGQDQIPRWILDGVADEVKGKLNERM